MSAIVRPESLISDDQTPIKSRSSTSPVIGQFSFTPRTDAQPEACHREDRHLIKKHQKNENRVFGALSLRSTAGQFLGWASADGHMFFEGVSGWNGRTHAEASRPVECSQHRPHPHLCAAYQSTKYMLKDATVA
eukprot:s3927_g5.t1